MRTRAVISNIVAITTLVLLVASSFFVTTPKAHAQSFGSLNAQGLGGVLFQCSGLTNKLTSSLQSLGFSVDEVPVGDEKNKDRENRENCLDAVAYYMAKQVLAQFTQQTVNWINSGFQGEPLYIREPESFFSSIAEREVASIVGIVQAGDSPFSEATINGIVNSWGNYFQRNADYTLAQAVPTGNPADFHANFAIGGWDAFIRQTLHPGNNPLGHQRIVDEEITRRTFTLPINKLTTAQKELDQGDGFLSLKKCVQPSNYTPPPEPNPFTQAEWIAMAQDPDNNPDAVQHVCTKWETQTPGQAISEQLTTSLTSPTRQLELVDDVNQSLAAIFDALLNQLFTEGLNSLTSYNELEGDFNFGGYGDNSGLGGLFGNQSEWTDSVGGFDLATQLDWLIYIQERFLGDPGATIPEGIDPNTGEEFEDPAPTFSGFDEYIAEVSELALALEDLDMCIPGPNPTYKDVIARRVQEVEIEVQTELEGLGDGFGFLFGSITSKIQDNARTIIAAYKRISQEYIEKIDDKYRLNTPGNMPNMTPLGYSELRNLPEHLNTLDTSVELKNEIIGAYRQMEYIRDEYIDLLNALDAGLVTQEEFDIEYAVMRNMFFQNVQRIVTPDSFADMAAKTGGFDAQTQYVEGLTSSCFNEINNQSYAGQTRQRNYVSAVNGVVHDSSYPGVNGQHFLAWDSLDAGDNAMSYIMQFASIGTVQTPSSALNLYFDYGTPIVPTTHWLEDHLGVQ